MNDRSRMQCANRVNLVGDDANRIIILNRLIIIALTASLTPPPACGVVVPFVVAVVCTA